MRRLLAWTAAGFVVGAIATFVAVGAAAAGHGEYVPGALLFPFTMLLAVGVGTIAPPLVVLALMQYPFYGLVVGASKHSQRTLLYVLGVHIMAAILAAIAMAGSDKF